MIVAGFIVHAPDAFSDKEISLLYLAIYLIILVLGGGRYSIDALISQKKLHKY